VTISITSTTGGGGEAVSGLSQATRQMIAPTGRSGLKESAPWKNDLKFNGLLVGSLERQREMFRRSPKISVFFSSRD
jgi:hypothetical protein